MADRTKLQDWAHIAEIVDAVAVVLSVIYLGLQIGDNTKALHSQAHYDALMVTSMPVGMRIENESLNRILTVC